MITLLTMSERWGKAPSEIMGISDGYCAWCFDEAALYMRQKLFEEGEMPGEWTEKNFDIKSAVEEMKQRGGVTFYDRRRNDRGNAAT